ncbi:MAG: PD-(D/E)XK nuclease family protein, partial [Gammaproteobacteria bacterium]|nr:PD-(D/E)XK nuclease family protein [Gammaproteobacteria bacterium]
EAPLRQLLHTLQIEPRDCSADDDYSRMLDSIYHAGEGEELPLRERAARFAANVPAAPFAERLRIHGADSDEEEAHAVELQVRRWLLEGHRQIGIVTENRRLARRVRALLERAGISLEDAAGWALSTTSAAAILERWLQCVEENFPYRAMLDLLKSPFFTTEQEREVHLGQVYRIEQDVVLHENIGSGIERYRQHLRYRQQRLPPELGEQLQAPARLLGRLQQAAAPLQRRVHHRESDAAELLALLQQSLEALGITAQLSDDAAGMRLLEELQKMQQAVGHETVRMDWLAFRNWLGRSLERYNFRPPAGDRAVSLSGLSQTPQARFDALIIAAVEREHLPGTPAATPFFNDAVRCELELPTTEEQLAQRYYHFRRLLEAAPRVLLTHRRQHDGETIAPSPWLELLQAFHQLAYGSSLEASELRRLLADPNSQVVQRQRPLPPPGQRPQPALAAALIPCRYSASAYQQLLDCPYQFYAARGLGLAPPESIREALEKSDYGERVHRCLQAFHGDVADLPGPYTGLWQEGRRAEAITLLETISKAVFARDLEDNFLHRGWLQRWLQRIPAYIDWQMVRAGTWRVTSVEQQVQQEQALSGITLHGRLDRSDSDGAQQAIIDYKTGQTPRDEDVLAGEAVQLPFYVLLAQRPQQPVARVEYLALDGDKVEGKGVLEEPQLGELTHAVGARLEALQRQMLDGAGLPAWGDEKTCQYCQMGGICRRQAWEGQ